ncbi:MAG: 5-formyltetrahydrofolate cyclo-ligase [Cyanobacteria bacterium SIG30]|nr:5-formyltetrahydrofolate cyclo-ligase [Cyanobacteria bacterium SIG30]
MQQFQLTLNKEQLRKYCKNKRLELYNNGQLEKISKKIVEKILSSEDFIRASRVALFYPKKCEIDVTSLLKYDKTFYLPRCKDKNLEICEYKNGDILKESNFKVMEPINEKLEDLSILDIIVIPALCADKKGNRLGYGAGFYDRLLKDKTIKAKKIVVVPNDLLFDEITNEKHDIKCDKIISA